MSNSNVVAERAVLATIYKYGRDAWIDCCDIIQDPNSFTIESNQVIYKCFEHIFTTNQNAMPDIPTIYAAAEVLNLKGFLNQKTEREHLKAVTSLPVNLSNVTTLAAQVRKLHITRMLREQLSEADANLQDIKGTEPISQILGLVEKPIFDFSSCLTNNDNIEASLAADGMGEWLDYIESHPCDIIGISSGYPLFDMAIGGGFRRKSVSLVGARIKKGKTHLANNIAENTSSGEFNNNIPVPTLVLDTEMVKEEQWPRWLAYLSNVGITEIEKGKYADNELKRMMVREGFAKLQKYPLYHLNISGRPFEETLGLIRRWLYKRVGFDENGKLKDCLIIYDYIKLMNSEDLNKGLAEFQMLGFIMTSLHNFMVKYDAPCLAFNQLNRDGIENEGTDVIAGSDRIGWLCSNFSIFKDKSDEEIAADGIQVGNYKLVNLFARHGEGLASKDYINLFVDKKTRKIKEGKLKSQCPTQNQQVVDFVDKKEDSENKDDNKKSKPKQKQLEHKPQDDRF